MAGFLRVIFITIDKVIYGLIDASYNLIFGLSRLVFDNQFAKEMMKNLYIIVGVFALIRIALLLVNSLIDPEKLTEKGKGLSNIYVRTVIMLVLLVLTPTFFSLAYELQSNIIGKVNEPNSGHIIEKIILGDKAATISDTSKDYTPGDQFKSIAISSMISVNHEFARKVEVDSSGKVTCGEDKKCPNGKGKYLIVPSAETGWTGGYVSKCDTNACTQAIDAYNKMYVDGKMDIGKLSSYITTSEQVTKKSSDDDDSKQVTEKEFVYEYNVLINTIVAGFIVYIMLGFALDIAVRFFELAALEILAPLFIVSFIDPKSASSGMFSKWLKQVGTTYAGLFIRIAVISLLILFVSILNVIPVDQVIANDDGKWVKLTLFLGALMFAKKMPKLFSDMIGIQGDGGLGTLGLGKKIAEGAIGGALIAKGAKGLAKGAAGVGLAGAKSLRHVARDRRKFKKENPDLGTRRARKNYQRQLAVDNLNKGAHDAYDKTLKKTGDKRKAQAAGDAYLISESNANKANAAAKAQIKSELEKAHMTGGARAMKVGNALLNGALTFKAAATADKLSGSLKVAKERSKEFKDAKGLQGISWFDKQGAVGKAITGVTDRANTYMYGNVGERAKRADAQKEFENAMACVRPGSKWDPKVIATKASEAEMEVRYTDPDTKKTITAKGDVEKWAMRGYRWSGLVPELDENGKLSVIKDKNGKVVEDLTKMTPEQREKYVMGKAQETIGGLSDYGVAQFLKYNADLDNQLYKEYADRSADLNGLQQRIANATNNAANALGRALESSLSKLRVNIPDLKVDNISEKLAELGNKIATTTDPAEKENLEATRASLQQLSESISINNSARYENGLITVDGLNGGQAMTPDQFREIVQNGTGMSAETQMILKETMNHHIDLAAANNDYNITQQRIEAILPAVEGSVYLIDKATGLPKMVDGEPVVIQGNLAHVQEVKTGKANTGYEEAKRVAIEKGDIKDENAN